MKIAVPIEETKERAEVSKSFGRSSGLFIYDTETKETLVIENEAKHSKGGAGIKAAQAIVDNHADVLLTPQCGENAAEVLEAANIKLYKTEGSNLLENIDNFVNGKLVLLEEIHAGLHGHE